MEKIFENNLQRSCTYLRTLGAICDNLQYNKNYKPLDNIVIYNESGILVNTDIGFFDSDIESETIKGGINFLRTEKQKEKAILNKENFVIKSEPKDYKFEIANTLYIYYKNIDYKVISIEKSSLFLEVNYTIFNDKYKESSVIGSLTSYSTSVFYKEVKNNIDYLYKNSYDSNIDKIKDTIKKINKGIKKYEKAKEEEKNYPIEKLITGTRNTKEINMEIYKNNMELLQSK